MRTVVVSGGWRTGSTLVWNVAKRLVHPTGQPYIARLVSDPADIRSRPKWSIYKCHVWMPTGNERGDWTVLHTTRDPIDVAGSLMRIKGYTPEQAAAEVLRQRILLAGVTQQDIPTTEHTTVLPYEDWYGRTPELVTLIADLLGVPDQPNLAHALSVENAHAIGGTLEPGEQDPDTLLQGDHVSPGMGAPGYYAQTLPAETLAYLHDLVYF